VIGGVGVLVYIVVVHRGLGQGLRVTRVRGETCDFRSRLPLQDDSRKSMMFDEASIHSFLVYPLTCTIWFVSKYQATRKQGDVEISNFPISLRDGLVIDVSFVCEFTGSSRAPGGWESVVGIVGPL